jgi:Neuraminidase (sialidase)
MKKLVIFLLLSLTIIFAGCTIIQDFDKEAAIKMTEPIMDKTMEGLNENNYEKFTEFYTDSYKESFPESAFFKFTEGFYNNPGRYISREVYDVRPITNGVIIHYKGIFETRNNVAITVTFELSNEEYKIKKIRFY